MGGLRQLIVGFEAMRFDGGVARPQMGRQGRGDRRCLLAVVAAAFEGQAHGVGMRHVAVESVADSDLDLAGAVSATTPRPT
jgi:methanogenic corrinoid protein MtbC1